VEESYFSFGLEITLRKLLMHPLTHPAARVEFLVFARIPLACVPAIRGINWHERYEFHVSA
jgi:hypothetical protein